jgi:hypothetical protein
MNKLITTNNGGMPFELDDLRFQDEGYREAFKGLLSALGGKALNDGYILSGVVATDTGSNFTTTEGWVAFNGEIWYIPGKTLPYLATGFKYVFEEDNTFDATGNESFEDGSVNDTYQIRRAKLTSKIVITPEFEYMTWTPAPGTVVADTYADKINSLTHSNISILDSITSAGSSQIITTVERNKISTNESDIAAINAGWTTASLTASDVQLRFLDDSTTNATIGSGTFKYKIIGDSLHFIWNATGIQVPVGTLGVTSTYVTGIDFSISKTSRINGGTKTAFYALVEETTGLTSGSKFIISGNGRGVIDSNTDYITVRQTLPITANSDIAFNFLYDYDTSGAQGSYDLILATAITNYDIAISGVIELN